MKKEYLKPEVELIKFTLKNPIAVGEFEGEQGSDELPEGWE